MGERGLGRPGFSFLFSLRFLQTQSVGERGCGAFAVYGDTHRGEIIRNVSGQTDHRSWWSCNRSLRKFTYSVWALIRPLCAFKHSFQEFTRSVCPSTRTALAVHAKVALRHSIREGLHAIIAELHATGVCFQAFIARVHAIGVLQYSFIVGDGAIRLQRTWCMGIISSPYSIIKAPEFRGFQAYPLRHSV